LALVAHDAQSIQWLVDRFSLAAKQFSLKINIKKNRVPIYIYQPVKNQHVVQPPGDIAVYNEALVQTKNFVNLGRTISDNARLDCKLIFRMGKASAAYEELRERLWDNHHVSLHSLIKVTLPLNQLFQCSIIIIYESVPHS